MSRFQLIIRRENRALESKLSFTKGESLLLLCKKAGISMETPCGGKGSCGKCKVKFTKNPPLPQPAERRSLTPEELRQGIRLACVAKPPGDCEVLVPGEKKPDAVGGAYDISWEYRLGGEGSFIVADIGTTTLVMERRRKCDGRIEAVYKEVNDQRTFGADVLSRMEASLSGRGKELSEMMVRQLEKGIGQLYDHGEKADFMVVAANTTMVHLLMDYSVEGLGRAPFVPVSLDEIVTKIAGIRTYIMPGFSAFVGGDIGAGLYMLDYLKERTGRKQVEGLKGDAFRETDLEREWNLFIDLGTNAELVLYRGNSGICCAAAAGPAFDGDAGTGIFGSDMIAVLAKLLEQGIVDKRGTLDDAHFETGASVAVEGGTITLSQKQIRNLQLAKAAVRSGIEVLLQKAGIGKEQIGHVFLAGGFGYYLDVRGAVQIGLLPVELENRTEACGNTALLGAAVYGYRILTGVDRSLPVQLKAINLAEEKEFNESYVNHMDLTK